MEALARRVAHQCSLAHFDPATGYAILTDDRKPGGN